MKFTSVVSASVVLVVAGFLAACDSNSSKAIVVNPPVTNAVARPAVARAALKKLLGKWERPDGGYVLEFKSVDAEGRFVAAYFNPSPINVEQARAEGEGEVLRLQVVLRDANYPGCIYKLTYDAKSDQMLGTYFQAAMGQTYDVSFVRLKSATP